MKSRRVKNILKVLLLSIFTFAFFIHSNNVFAQIDINAITPIPNSSSPQPAGQFQPGGGGSPPKCITADKLKNQVRVGGIIVGQRHGESYAISRNDNSLTAKRLSNRIGEIVDRTGIAQDSNRQYAGASQNAEGVLRRNQDISDELYSSSLSQNDKQCAVRITGSSPTIFIYFPNTKVQPIVPVLYLEQNDQYIYYEYDRTNISFNKPEHGWIINKDKLSEFVNKISGELKLTSLEKERLLFELNFSVSDVNSDKLFIGLIPQKEIDEVLPLKISSQNNPKVIRYHFYVAEAKNNDIKPPKLNPVQRAESLILELGSWGEK